MMMMHHRIKKGSSLSVLLLRSSQKQQQQQGLVFPSQQASKLPLLLAIEERLVLSDHVGGVCSPPAAAAAAMGSRRFFHAEGGAPLVKLGMFRAGGDTRILFSGWKTRGCVGGFVPHQCSISHMRPYCASNLTSQSSAQTPRQFQEPTKTKKKECLSSSKGQRETDDETSSTKVSLNQFPGLMAVQFGLTPPERIKKSKTRRLLQLNPDTGYFEEQQDVAAAAANHHSHDELQVPYGHVCRGSAYGWLFLTDENLDMKLLNPFSGAEIQLPPVKTLPLFSSGRFPLHQMIVWKAVFSANPSVEPRPVILVIYGPQNMAFCKPGDEGWTPLEFPTEVTSHWHHDAIYHKGQFYVLSSPGYVAAYDIGRRIDDDDHSVKISLLGNPPKRGWIYHYISYLVVVDGELIRIELRRGCFCDNCKEGNLKTMEIERECETTDEDITTDEEEEDYDGDFPCIEQGLHNITYGIKLRRLDVSEKQWVKMESLGDKAVFVGYNTSFALSASDYPAGVCIPDSIYFTFGRQGYESFEMDCYDMGIYNLKDKTIKPLIYPPMMPIDGVVKPAPIWIVNASCSDGKIERCRV